VKAASTVPSLAEAQNQRWAVLLRRCAGDNIVTALAVLGQRGAEYGQARIFSAFRKLA
jgi:hypothetical protein